MISIVRKETEVKEYIMGIKKLFDLYKTSKKFETEDSFLSDRLSNLIKCVDNNEDYNEDTIKGRIFRENILGNKTLDAIAKETNYSVAHIYNHKQKILKEFAAMVFEVIII